MNQLQICFYSCKKKYNVVGKIFKGVAQRADVIQLPFVFVFVLVLHLYLYLYWLDAKEGKRWDGASCHSTAARFIKLSADALLSPQLNPIFYQQSEEKTELLSLHFFFWDKSEEPHGLSRPIGFFATFPMIIWTISVLKIEIWFDFDFNTHSNIAS